MRVAPVDFAAGRRHDGRMIQTLLLVGLGGALGAVGRYLAVLGAARAFGAGFPVGTLAVNVVGSFLIGALAILLMGPRGASPLLPFVVTGFLGGFTTFSAFSLDALKLWQAGQAGLAAVYVLASVGLSLAAVVAGGATAAAMRGYAG